MNIFSWELSFLVTFEDQFNINKLQMECQLRKNELVRYVRGFSPGNSLFNNFFFYVESIFNKIHV